MLPHPSCLERLQVSALSCGMSAGVQGRQRPLRHIERRSLGTTRWLRKQEIIIIMIIIIIAIITTIIIMVIIIAIDSAIVIAFCDSNRIGNRLSAKAAAQQQHPRSSSSTCW